MDTTDAVPSDPKLARELTRRLIAHEAPDNDGSDAFAMAVRVTVERTLRELGRWLGANGSRALVLRALAQARLEHPALAEIRVLARAEPALEGVAESSQTHGPTAVAQGLEALLVALFDLLGRLIGIDMTAQLVERGGARSSPRIPAPTTAPDANETSAPRDPE